MVREGRKRTSCGRGGEVGGEREAGSAWSRDLKLPAGIAGARWVVSGGREKGGGKNMKS